MSLPPSAGRPFEVVSGEEVARSGPYRLRRERLRWPSGLEQDYTLIEAPPAAVMVPLFEDGTTVLVRQWRHAWGAASWELPAGTVEDGEEPLACARRELEEEAGLRARSWLSLGTARGTAAATVLFHLFLAEGLEEVERSPEDYEQDMVIHRLPLAQAVREALDGGIQHAVTIAALLRAADRRNTL